MSATDTPKRHYRKIIKISAEDSPNVQLGLAQKNAGLPITNESLVPGVLSYREYCKRRDTWDKVKQCICLDGNFFEGADVLLYPPQWLNRAERLAKELLGVPRQAKGIGIDPAEGGDKTTMAAVDELGVIEIVGKPTPDTSVITGEAIAFMRKHNVSPSRVVFDLGGGGKEHADRLRSEGYAVATVGFGMAVHPQPQTGMRSRYQKIVGVEDRYTYVNRRSQMYGTLRNLLDPGRPGKGFAISEEFTEFRRQISPIPLIYDREGRLKMLPKNRQSASGNEQTLMDLIGCSPDEADAVVLAIHAMLYELDPIIVGAI